jgi:6-pyruvoyltetrahydropterin/6-carboxytetrahydropterin synthase
MTAGPFTIAKSFSFDASHQLAGLPTGHKCARLHGHTYSLTVELSAPALDDVGFVLDYGELQPVKALVDGELDHRHLNAVLGTLTPTAEHLAWWLFGRIAPLVDERGGTLLAVRVSETPATWAEYRPDLRRP